MTDTPDFSSFFLTDASAIDIDLPNGEPMLYGGERVRVHVFGPATSQYIKANESSVREATKRIVNEMGVKGKKKEKEDPEADAKFLVAITNRIENFPYPGGADAIYREPKLKYIADQVRSAVNDQTNFFKGVETP